MIETLSFTPETAPEFFPNTLWKVLRPPTTLHIQGKPQALRLLEKLPERGLAIVGSRSCQQRSRQIIEEVLTPLQGFDWIILSGLARGVDAYAHEAALKLGFPTIAILGCGLNITYPAENQDLRQRILAAGGLVVTELPADHEPAPWAFIHRNRLIAGWARATWVVQAGFRSGALNTASWTIQHERTLFATPAFPGDPGMIGNQKLLSDRAAHCSWNSRSFGQVWLEIESFLAQRWTEKQTDQRNQFQKGEAAPEELLAQEVKRRTAENGGVRLSELLGWALETGWTPEQFFETAARSGLMRPNQVI